MQHRDELLQTISDLSKDAYGFRVRMDYASMSDTDLEATYDSFLKAADERNFEDCIQHINAQRTWEKRIEGFITQFGVDRATAIRWDMQAYNVDNRDFGYYCYLNGLAYELEERIILDS